MTERSAAGYRTALQDRLSRGLSALEQSLPTPVQARLLDYVALLQRWNRAYNLTSVRSPAEMVDRHLVDSLSLRPFLDGDRIVDAGTGAGLPGLVLAIAEPERTFVLVDSNAKKVRFLRHVQREFGLSQVEIRQVRIEALAMDLPAPDQVVARALAPLERMAGWLAPWLDQGSRLLAMKGRLDADECAALPSHYNVEVHPLEWPGQTAARCVAVIRAGDPL